MCCKGFFSVFFIDVLGYFEGNSCCKMCGCYVFGVEVIEY